MAFVSESNSVTAQARQGTAIQARVGRTLARGVTCALALAAVGFALGYAGFAMSLARDERDLDVQAEGVVALTGGSDRVAEAAELLAKGHAPRLLITGVNRATRGSALARRLSMPRDLFNCCVDLGYGALDTIGNARETAEWAKAHGISRSLIVVTSNYHMPRAMAELSAALPDVTIYPFPVVSEHVNVADWARDFDVARLIGSEYVKYLGSYLRIMLALADSAPEPPRVEKSLASK